MKQFRLLRNLSGQLTFVSATGDAVHEGVVPVRAFPIAAPDAGVAIMSAEGHELAWIERLSDLTDDIRCLIEEELAGRNFLPEIRRLRQVSGFATPSTWHVDTDRGETSFVLNGADDIRCVGRTTLLIADSRGLQFLIRDLQSLDKPSRRLLDRFL